MDYAVQLQKLLQIGKKRWILVVALVTITHLFCQSVMLPYGNALLSLLPGEEVIGTELARSLPKDAPVKSAKIEHVKVVTTLDTINSSLLVRAVKNADNDVGGGYIKDDGGNSHHKDKNSGLIAGILDNDTDFMEDATIDNDNPLEEVADSDDGLMLKSDEGQDQGSYVISRSVAESSNSLPLEQVVKDKDETSVDSNLGNGNGSIEPSNMRINSTATTSSSSARVGLMINLRVPENQITNSSNSPGSSPNISAIGGVNKLLSDGRNYDQLKRDFATLVNSSAGMNGPVKKTMRCNMPPKTITYIQEMERLLVRHHARSRAMRPRWSSERDREILAAKFQIENSPLNSDSELYAPLFRNVSMFKRSYELMERTLKIYVYKDGDKPIFHQPILKGLYASEGWFMKLMEGNKHFVVKDPRRAHLFYMPFSSRMLEYTLYVRNSHNRTNLRQYLKEYSEKIAAKYRFWNRTGGADHFLVACHDWAPYETRHHMEHCIKALCNADVTVGFKIGRDVSLPETYVRSARNPLRDLGGKPALQRHILAFYAGNMHGYLRQILLKHWKDKDPDMKIWGPMPLGVASKMNYIQHMKSSRYCICPKGYEVNSPRVVEAIFYECVPVIISDNFVPPFFEILNWNTFSIILAEKDIPNLKDILLSIPEDKYLSMQLGVRKVQKHFLWHAKPTKYDLFHMTLHSIWYNRVFQVKVR